MNSNNCTPNNWADFWRNTIGVNVIPADTANKIPVVKLTEWQDKPIPIGQHEKWKRENAFSKGMAIIVGKAWHTINNKGLKLVFIDADNQKAIDEICEVFNVADLNELSQVCIVEQHKDQLHKAHIYFYSAHDFQKKSSDAKKFKDAIEKDQIPAIEAKGHRGHGIAYCTPSLHKNGCPYEIIGIKIPKVFGKEIEEGLFQIYKKYGLGENEDISGIRMEKLFESGFKILAGHNRHEALLRVMESHLAKYGQRISEEDIKSLAHKWNEEHCDPPLPEEDFERQWKDAKKFIERQSPNKKYPLLESQYGQLSHQSVSNAMTQIVTAETNIAAETNIVIVDSGCLFRVYEHSLLPKVYYVDKKRGQIMSGKLTNSFIMAEKSIINISPQTLIYHKNPIFRAATPKIEIKCIDGFSIGPLDNVSDLTKKLEVEGFILNKSKASDALNNIMVAMRAWPG